MLFIFDLDGTLIDSSQDLANAVNATLEHFERAPIDPKLIYSYVGSGAAILVRRAFGPDAPEELVQDALAYFLEYYEQHAKEQTHLYPGIPEALDELANGRHKLAILTNKPAKISADIVSWLGIKDRFARIYGGDSFAHKKPHPIGIQTLMAELGTPQTETLMIGDSGVDVQTARNAGVRSYGVAWGFQPESFRDHPPDLLIQDPKDLLLATNGNL